MRIVRLGLPAFLLFLFLGGCQRRKVQLAYTNARGEVPALGNLVFHFNQALIPDSLLDRWDSTAYLSFEPHIAGRFRWESPDQLVFSPLEPLAPATDYQATLGRELLRYSRFNQVTAPAPVRFHTPSLRLENAQVVWVSPEGSGGSAAPRVDLAFNYPVDPAALQAHLHLTVDQHPASFTLVTASADRQVSLLVGQLALEDRDYPASLTIDPGLKPMGGSRATTEKLTSDLPIPSPFVLTVQSVEADHDGQEGTVRVVTSQQLTGEDLSALIRFTPAVKFRTELQDDGLIIRSDQFDADKSYTLTLAKGLRGRIGGTLRDDYAAPVTFGQLEASIRFTNSKAMYLSANGERNISVQITNVPRVKLVISKIYENNLLMAGRYGYYPAEKDPDRQQPEEVSDDGDQAPDGQLGDVLIEKVIDTRSLPRSGGGRLLNLARFEDQLPEFRGIYHVMIRSLDDYWVRDSRFVSLSDIGLMARQGQDRILVFANSIKSATALSGVLVTAYGANNQLLGTGTTDAQGVAQIPCLKKDFSGFQPALVIARSADDFTYLPFSSTRVNTSRFDVGGKRGNPSGLDAWIYPERDIYRPGETLHFSVLVRDGQWKSPGSLPVRLKFLLPDGKELSTVRKVLNAEGSLEGSLPVSESAITGSYTLEVYTSTDVLLASRSFSVEEFVPDRVRVDLRADRSTLRPGETANLQISAQNFFGPPAAGRPYETEIQVKQKNFTADRYREYDFSLTNQRNFFDKELRQGHTDEAGKASERFEAKQAYQNLGELQADFYATVFDETGRPVSRTTSVAIFTQDVFFGIRQDGYDYYPLNQVIRFPLVAVNREGNAVTAQGRVQVIKHEYRTVLAHSGSYFRYESQKQDRILSDNTQAIGPATTFSYIPRSPGDYEVRVFLPGAGTYVSRSFYSYGSWGGDNSSFEVNTEGQIDIETDRPSYQVGQTVKALFKTPFSGRMLVTLETDHVLSYQYVNVDKRTASLDLPVSAEDLPNVYISATLIKPHDLSDIPLTVAHGYQSIRVEDPQRRLPVTLVAQASVRSNTRQHVRVRTTPGSYVTLAAVDNGVLQVTDFKTPDPYQYFYQKRALQVSNYDLYPLLFPELRASLSSTGGDGELSLDRRVNPMPAKRIRVVSYWSGIVQTNGRGEAEFELDIPAFSGQVRLMAVAYKGQGFGSAEQAMTVADPVVISTALPRFLSPGDSIQVSVNLSNTTDREAMATADLAVTGPLRVIGASNLPVRISARGEAMARYTLTAAPQIGTGKVQVSVRALGEQFRDETELSIRPASTLQKRSGSGTLTAGTSQVISAELADFIPSSARYRLVVSRSPVLGLADQLSELIQYPFGCTEQTISAAFPQLYYGDLADLLQQGRTGAGSANTNVQEAIRKIRMRQLYNGAVTLWDGEGQEDWWTTIYAAHFLLEARKAGFDVETSLLETMLEYISGRLRKKELITYYYNRDQQRKIAPKEVAYGLYVLALAGRSNVPAMNYYKANASVLALDSRYLLSAAYATAGDKRSFGELLPAAFQGESSVPQTGGSYASPLRDEAIALNALLEVDPANPQVPVMARHVSERIRTSPWLSTQERSFAFLALGKLARSVGQSNAEGEIRSGGRVLARSRPGQGQGRQDPQRTVAG